MTASFHHSQIPFETRSDTKTSGDRVPMGCLIFDCEVLQVVCRECYFTNLIRVVFILHGGDFLSFELELGFLVKQF